MVGWPNLLFLEEYNIHTPYALLFIEVHCSPVGGVGKAMTRHPKIRNGRVARSTISPHALGTVWSIHAERFQATKEETA